jgi:circadian clock protein KaiC
MRNSNHRSNLAATGLFGLDIILQGGLPRGRTYLIEGSPGVGKTTLGIQFLLEGVRTGERVMLVSLIETREELFDMAKSHGWNLNDIHIMELPQGVKDTASSLQTVFPPGEVEFGEMANALTEGIEQYKPDRLLLDSVSQLSMLTDSWYQLRGPILTIRDLLHRLKCTTLLTSSNVGGQIGELVTIVHGSILMEMKAPAYGQVLREMIVKKMRGHRFITGYHNYRIRTGGLEIFAWPEPKKDSGDGEWQVLSSGIQELDDLLGGGLEEGTACLLTGSSGAGTSTLGSLYVEAAARRGENSIIFCFDERRETFIRRCASLNLNLPAYIEQGLVDLRQVNTGELSSGEFAQLVCKSVEEKRAKVVVIDSLTGYMSAIPEEKLQMVQIHELLSYLSGARVLTILVVSKFGLTDDHGAEIDASYIADTVIVLRHFEALGTIRRCIAVIKKRHGNHEHMIREFKIAAGGCQVGPPLNEFSGILTGNPVYIGKPENLLGKTQKS